MGEKGHIGLMVNRAKFFFGYNCGMHLEIEISRKMHTDPKQLEYVVEFEKQGK